MFTRNHYINLISLGSIGIINSLFIFNVFSGYSVYYPILFFILFILSVTFIESKLKPDKKNYIRVIVALLSPAVYYLLLVEYEILVNIILLIFLFFLSEKYTHKTRIDLAFLIFSFLFGVLLSADSTMFIIFVIYLLYLFRSSIWKIFIFFCAAAVVYTILLITYDSLDNNVAIPANPLEIRSLLSLIPFWGTVLIFLCSLYLGWIVTDLREVFFSGGLMLFILSLILIIVNVIEIKEYSSYTAVLYMSNCAVSIPFFILAIKQYKVDKYLGKITVINEI